MFGLAPSTEPIRSYPGLSEAIKKCEFFSVPPTRLPALNFFINFVGTPNS